MMTIKEFQESLLRELNSLNIDSLTFTARESIINNKTMYLIDVDDTKNNTDKRIGVVLEDPYKEFVSRGDISIHDTAVSLVSHYYDVMKGGVGNITSSEYILNNLSLKVINYERNKEMLKNYVHRKFLDLAVVYEVITQTSSNAIYSYKIPNKMPEILGITEDEMFNLALKNNTKINGHKFVSVDRVIEKALFGESDIDEEYREVCKEMIGSGRGTFILSNDRNIDGASEILYNTHLMEIAELFETDIVIIPSSINELIIMPLNVVVENDFTSADIHEIVRNTNASDVVTDDEFLSDSVYIYKRSEDKVKILEEGDLH